CRPPIGELRELSNRCIRFLLDLACNALDLFAHGFVLATCIVKLGNGFITPLLALDLERIQLVADCAGLVSTDGHSCVLGSDERVMKSCCDLSVGCHWANLKIPALEVEYLRAPRRIGYRLKPRKCLLIFP